MLTEELIITLIFCVIFSLIGSELGHRHKKIDRNGYGKFAIGLVTGFAGFLLVLMLRRFVELDGLAMYSAAAVFCALYSYLMSNAKVFSDLR
jgi:hypothetical protein